MKAVRRSLTIGLPASDPLSERIHTWLDAQPEHVDVSALLRRLIVTGLDIGTAFEGFETRLLAALMNGSVTLPLIEQPALADQREQAINTLSPEDSAALDILVGSFD